MLQVLQRQPQYMAGRRVHAQALVLVVLMVLSGGLSSLLIQPSPAVLLNEEFGPKHVRQGDEMNITVSTTPNSGFKLELQEDEPLVSAELEYTPRILPTQSGFVWDDANDWNHPDALSNGSVVQNGALTGSSAGVLWDFNTNNQGWTFSGYGARVSSPTCGMNGSSGGSLRTYAGSSYATSPVMNLAGGVNIPFHAWVRQGSSGCGEEPDSNENLYFQYKNSGGSWVNFRTFSGSTSGGSVTPFQMTLPAAAVHASSQFRIHQNSGSGTCCDYWFVDDVHIATPPESNWTSPSLGHASGVTQVLPSNTYSPLHLDATIPQGSYLNWSILNSAGEPLPGMHGSNQLIIPLNLIDYTVIDEFRLHLEFKGEEAGIPLLHSVSGDGDQLESFRTSPVEKGWVLNGAQHYFDAPTNSTVTGCGIDDGFADIESYPSSPVFNISQTFRADILLKCNPLGKNVRVQWSILNETGSTSATGSFSITSTSLSTAYLARSISTNQLTNMAPMNYTLQTEYQLRQSTTSPYIPLAWSNATFSTVNWSGSSPSPLNQPSDCEDDRTTTTVDVFSHQDAYLRKEVADLYIFGTCIPPSTNLKATWSIVDHTGLVHDTGQVTWNTQSTLVSRSVTGISLVNSNPGLHAVNVVLEMQNSTTSQWSTVGSRSSSFMLDWHLDETVGGNAFDTAESPWYLPSGPVYDFTVDASVTNVQVQARHHPLQPWSNVTLPFSPQVEQDTVGVQLRFMPLPPTDGNMSNFTYWYVEDLGVSMYGGQLPSNIGLDVDNDGRYEWGRTESKVGRWGWQDRFITSEKHMELTVTNGAASAGRAWVPQSDLTSFRFGYVAESGYVDEVSLFVQNTLIANRSNLSSSGTLELTPTEFESMVNELGAVTNTVDVYGTEFTEVRIEVRGQGVVVLSGLQATYNASQRVVYDSSSALVVGVNNARTSVNAVGGIESVVMPFIADERGGLNVKVHTIQTSASVVLQEGSMEDPEGVLTPSSRWETISTEYTVVGSPVSFFRLDVYSSSHAVTWLFPQNGNAPVALGDASLVELHPTEPISVTENNLNVVTNITFRVRPMWNDEPWVTATSRLITESGVVSIPFLHTWGSFSSQGYENDLEIKGMSFFEADELMPPSRQYLRGGESMNISVNVGFEDLNSLHGFVEGDARLTLYRDGVQIRNTTELDGTYWNITESIPFTYGDVTWTVHLESLNGSTVIDPAEFDRTFTVDSVKPRVIGTSMEAYDHREPSPTQVMQVTILDQPVLPSAMSAMVWKEWVDDTNLNGWPDEGEYQSTTMLLPSDLTALTGVYTLMIDDTAGSLGQKVAVYLEGTDPSGYAIQDGGSADEDDQLFIYQLAIDGAPELMPDAFGWVGGRQSWIHPGQPYELNVKITEPNGGSDLATVDVMLASNQGSDPMTIEWAFASNNCSTESIHIVIESCTMLGANGLAGPFEKDMTLNIQLSFGWNTPDLGDNRREPAILVVDRAGQEELRAFPEHRWRFSAGLSIPEESVDLHLTRGAFLGDGARVTPLTPMEISGGLVFSETSTVPAFDCDVNVFFAGQSYVATAVDGIWSVPVQAPASSGSLPMTWEVGCLRGQGVDLTDEETSVKWIVVDGTGPSPVEVLSPRPLAILGGENHEVRVVVNELGGLDLQSLELVWTVEDFNTGDTIRSGREALSLEGEALDGLRLELFADMNLTEITDEMLIDRMIVKIAIEGRDLAGNPVTGLDGDLTNPVLSTWNMEWLQPKFAVSPTSMTYSRLLMDVGDATSIQLEVENIGTRGGSTEVTFEAVNMDGERTLIQRLSVTAEAGAVGVVSVDWQPTEPGMQWVEATLENGQTSSGPTVDVRVAEEPSFTQKVFGDVNPLIGTVTALLLIAVVLSLLIWMKRMTVNQGSKIAYDWDEYSSELEEEEETFSAAAVAATTSSASAEEKGGDGPTAEEETDWVMGSDGYWWYHDKTTNEWWYKDANGEIVKHP